MAFIFITLIGLQVFTAIVDKIITKPYRVILKVGPVGVFAEHEFSTVF